MTLKRKKFLELANKRVPKALHTIELIGNLSNTSAYEYTDKDVRAIIKALEEATAEIKLRFKSPGGTRKTNFALGDV